jgi:hypothetical protein
MAYYIHAINESVTLQDFFPDLSESITEKVKNFALWRKPRPDLWTSDHFDYDLEEASGRDEILSGLSAFYTTRANDVIHDNLNHFVQKVTDQTKEALAQVLGVQDDFKFDMEAVDKVIKKTWGTTMDPMEDFVR